MADEPLILPQDEFEFVKALREKITAAIGPAWGPAAVRFALEAVDAALEQVAVVRLCPGCLHDRVLERALARAGAAEARLAEVRQTVATFLTVRGEDGTADLAEAIRQVLDREPLP